VAEDTSLVVAVCGAVNEDDPFGRTIAKVQARLQETVLHLRRLAPTNCGGVSALRLTSALTSVVQHTGMSQSESGLSLCFMSTTQTEVSGPDDRSASRQFLGQYSWCQSITTGSSSLERVCSACERQFEEITKIGFLRKLCRGCAAQCHLCSGVFRSIRVGGHDQKFADV
jgi:hypothetical protein